MADYAISNVDRRIVYTGSAGVGPYAFNFEVLAQTDIAVYKNSTLLTLTTNYTVSINPTTGVGSVTLTSAATSADTITIVGARAIERTTDFTTGGDLFANTLNDELDSQTILTQQVAETAERAIKAPVTDPTSIDMTLASATDRANTFMYFDANGEPAYAPVGDFGAPSAITRQLFSGDDSTTVFTLARDPGASGSSVVIYMGGVYQQSDTYTIVGDTLTFSEAPVTGTNNIEVVHFAVTDIGETDASAVSYIPAGTGAVATNVQTKLREVVSVKDFGAVGDGATDDQVAITAAIDAAVARGVGSVYFPSGTYIIGGTVSVYGGNIPAGTCLTVFGDGPSSLIKRKNNAISLGGSSFQQMLSFYPVADANANVKLTVRNLALDGNFANQGITPGIAELDYQQSACLKIGSRAAYGFDEVRVENVTFYDPLADGVNIAGSGALTMRSVIFSGIRQYGRTADYVRSDITITASYDDLILSDFDIDSLEVELNSGATSYAHRTVISNGITHDRLDLAYEGLTSGYYPVHMSNVIARKFAYLHVPQMFADNCRFDVSYPIRLLYGYYTFNGCRFFGNSDISGASTVGLVYMASGTTAIKSAEFNNCTFDADPAVPRATLPHMYWQDFTATSRIDVSFRSCRFLAPGYGIRARAIHLRVQGCEYAGSDALILHNASTSAYGESLIVAKNNYVTNPVGVVLRLGDVGSGGTVRFFLDGNTPYYDGGVMSLTGASANSRYVSPRGAGSAYIVPVLDVLETDTTPADQGYYIKGQRVRYRNVSTGNPAGAVCTTSGVVLKGAWTTTTAYTRWNFTSNGGRTYMALNAATSGATAPTHSSGFASDGGGVVWRYLHSSVTTEAAWVAATAYVAGNIRYNGSNVYIAESAGTSGGTAPTHTSGFAPDDGGVAWRHTADFITAAVFKAEAAIA